MRSSITPSTLLQSGTLASTAVDIPTVSTEQNVVAQDTQDHPIPVIDNFLEKLVNLIRLLPDTIPEATDYDKLAVFAGNPRDFDNPDLDADDLWEEVLNKVLKSALGWGEEENMDDVIRRGRKGLDGLTNFVKFFVVKRGVQMSLFEGKLAWLVTTLEQK